MRKRNIKIGIIAVVMFVFMIVGTNVFAAINESYYNQIKGNTVEDTQLDQKLGNSTLLDAISVLVYGVASLMEWILSSLSAAATGSRVFPWADAILFNAVPILDINVFNPSGASLVALIQDFISSTYWTVFSLAFSFFGIAIMITAIKLAISTIASDKARYKQAIVKWILGFVMLWGIHFCMSFLLYLNELLVNEASNMASSYVANYSINLENVTNSDAEQTVGNFVECMNNNQLSWTEVLGTFAVAGGIGVFAIVALPAITSVGAASGVLATIGAVAKAVVSTAAATALIGGGVYEGIENRVDKTQFITAQYDTIVSLRTKEYTYFKDTAKMEATAGYLKRNADLAAELLSNSDYVNALQAQCGVGLRGDTESRPWKEDSVPDAVYYLAADVRLLLVNNLSLTVEQGDETATITIPSYEELLNAYLASTTKVVQLGEDVRRRVDTSNWKRKVDSGYTESEVNYDDMLVWYCKGMTAVSGTSQEETTEAQASNIISKLADLFKGMAWSNASTSWKASKPTIQGALMYGILVAQSLIFFIAYAKRLFYIVILILLAPFVVVYDFFTKFSS